LFSTRAGVVFGLFSMTPLELSVAASGLDCD
jgi:hypothetical protein